MGMAMRLIPTHGDVDRRPDACLMTCVDLFLEEIARQTRVSQLGELCIVIDPPVVTAGEQSDRVHGSALQRLDELGRVKFTADPGNLFGSMEVEVYLSGT